MFFFLSPHLLLYSLTLPASSTSSTCPFHEPWHRDSHHPLDLSSPGMPLHWPSHPPTPPSLCVAMSAHPFFVPLEGDTFGKLKQLMQSACCKSTSMKSVTVKGVHNSTLSLHLSDLIHGLGYQCRDVWSSDISGRVP
ncbi:hypothetical protein C8R44DRAFT_894172 [Mycena epipterygia]|nr:hypothetical protein C8R44DRAFT_894172 [Mycena epipterygia]